MATITNTGLDALRARYRAAFARRLPDHIERLPWDAGRLAEYQRERLRALLACAIERSPFHAGRLRGVDPERFELDDLAGLPVTSKAQMMAGVDDLLTDRRLTRARAEAHLSASAAEPGLLSGQYVCLASGGSSGLPARIRPRPVPPASTSTGSGCSRSRSRVRSRASPAASTSICSAASAPTRSTST